MLFFADNDPSGFWPGILGGIAGVSAAIGVILDKLITGRISSRKQAEEQGRLNEDAAFNRLQAVCDRQDKDLEKNREQIAKHKADIDALTQRVDECEEDRKDLRAKVGVIEGTVSKLTNGTH